MTRTHRIFAIGLTSLVALSACGGNNPVANGNAGNQDRMQPPPTPVASFDSGGRELASQLAFTDSQQQQLERLMTDHANRTNLLVDRARIDNIGAVRIEQQMQDYDRAFSESFFELLTSAQSEKYDVVSKQALDNYYQSGGSVTSPLIRLIVLVELANA